RYVEPNYSKPQNLMVQPCSNVYGKAMRLMHDDSSYEFLDHGYGNYGQDGYNVNRNNYRNGFQCNFSQMNDVRYYCNHGGYNTNGFDNMNQIPNPNILSQQMYDSNAYSQQQSGNMSIDNYVDMERRGTNEAQLPNITDQAINYAISRYSFGVLYNENNWPKELGGSRIGMETKPSIPPQLAP
ncbi:unnamed protein product, partial [Didymodactylos carnosus]